jgi:hypothetical protein
MATLRHSSSLMVALLAGIVLMVTGGCAGEKGVERPPAAVNRSAVAQATPAAAPVESPPPVTGPAATIPIIDLHFHPDTRWDRPALVALFDELGVARAGYGGRQDGTVLEFAQQFPDRFFAFTGQETIEGLTLEQREHSTNLQSPALLAYLKQLEAGIQAGHFKGIGEIFANNLTVTAAGAGNGSHFPADSPLMQRLWQLSATYGVPLSVHMDATEKSVAEMERLLASDRQGTWIWAHTGGGFAEPPLLRRLLQTHPNLHCELSVRVGIRGAKELPPNLIPRPDVISILDHAANVRPGWTELLEEFPDRFVIGADVFQPSLDTYARVIGVWRHVLAQLSPETATKLAHGNAERLLGLTP